jgi:hypothetical protein
MLKVYDLAEITYDIFYNQHVLQNKPCIVKNFINEYNCKKSKINENISKDYIEYNIGTKKAYKNKYDSSICKNQLVLGLENDKENIIIDKFRLWKHNAGNITDWHCDGNGCDLFNISIDGAKDFYLAPPNSFPVYPFIDVVPPLPYSLKETYKVRLTEGDMLYIPAFWFHKVITLEDNTKNLNYIFFNKHLYNLPIDLTRHFELYALHKATRSRMCKQYICDIMDHKPKSFIRLLLRGLYEAFPFAAIYLVIMMLVPKHRILSTIIVIAILLFFIFSSYLEIIGVGLSRLVGTFTILWIFIFYVGYFFLHMKI